jgi:hypothetical protein
VISDTDLRDVRPYCSHNPRNLVTEHRWCGGDVVSSEKQVGVTQPSGLHIDENFASYRRGDVNILEIEASAERVNDESLHLFGLLKQERRATYRSRSTGIGTIRGQVARFELGFFSRVGLAFALFLRHFIFAGPIWQKDSNTSKTSLLLDQSR